MKENLFVFMSIKHRWRNKVKTYELFSFYDFEISELKRKKQQEKNVKNTFREKSAWMVIT